MIGHDLRAAAIGVTPDEGSRSTPCAPRFAAVLGLPAPFSSIASRENRLPDIRSGKIRSLADLVGNPSASFLYRRTQRTHFSNLATPSWDGRADWVDARS